MAEIKTDDRGVYYLHRKEMPDGREALVVPRMFNALISVGPPGADWYDTHWCYETPGQALMALEEWDGTGEPEGWFRHAGSGRRRPGGDPEKEYINL